jgi:nucleotide-binding universal stress UspA family protein
MTFGTVMVTVDPSEAARTRIRLAGHLADAFGASLLGVSAQVPIHLPPAGGPPVDAYVTPRLREACLDGLARAHAVFEEAAAGRSRNAWVSDVDFPLSFVVRQAARAGLVVTGRPGADEPPCLVADTGDLVMNLGRPLLVVPREVDHLDGRRVALGWRNTREARRAVSDALPFLRRASKVVVVGIDEGGGTCSGEPVIRYLAGFGIQATAVRASAEGAGTAEALVDLACEHAADLLVTGAYGHSRLREWAFGGVTRDLLRGCPICCLLSH